MSSRLTLRKTLLAELLVDAQPAAIRRRLCADREFSMRVGLTPGTVYTVGDAMKLEQQQLFAAARQALKDRTPVRVSTVDRNEIEIGLSDDGVTICRVLSAGAPIPARDVLFPELRLLSPRQEDRCAALKDLRGVLDPTSSRVDEITEQVNTRELTNEEVALFISERISGVAALQEKMRLAIEARNIAIDDIVPGDARYYEELCGPDPLSMPPDRYIEDVLPEFRKTILRRDVTKGLHICLLGSLRDDLSPAAWTAEVAVDTLWTAVEAYASERNPFALLGMLEIALVRRSDVRYRELAEHCIDKLLQESLPRSDGNDTYELLGLLARLTLNRLNTFEGLATRQPFWKRMCAWMQAGVIADAILEYRIDSSRFREWAHDRMRTAGEYRRILDLQSEPMYHASELSRTALRDEILGRLRILRMRFTGSGSGERIPKQEAIDARLAGGGSTKSLSDFLCPGPLEGHRRPAEDPRRLIPDQEATGLIEHFGRDLSGPLLSVLAHLSQRFDIGATLLRHVTEAVRGASLASLGEDHDDILRRLPDGCLVAAAQRDTTLASAIGDLVVSGSHDNTPAADVVSLLHCVIVAASAFETQRESAEWLEQKLTQIATRLRRGEPTRVFLQHLVELKTVIEGELCVHGRAEALACAAE